MSADPHSTRGGPPRRGGATGTGRGRTGLCLTRPCALICVGSGRLSAAALPPVLLRGACAAGGGG